MSPRLSYHAPQTSKQAKAAYKKNGARVSEREIRQIERNVELQERADRLKEKERRRKSAVQKKTEKVQKDRAARAQLGLGLATQMAGYSHTQHALKRGMEAFLGISKKSGLERNDSAVVSCPVEEALEKIIEEDTEPWEGGDQAIGLDEMATDISPRSRSDNAWSQDGLDDEMLLQAHEQAMSSEPWDEKDMDDALLLQAVDENTASATNQQAQPQSQPFVPSQRKPTPRNQSSAKPPEETECLRLHGPFDKAVEKLLASLPEPMIELLSQDVSARPQTWNPAPSLLHRLNPPGFPPHRLRLKVGCTVVLLKDLNTNSSQLSRSGHLRILKIAKERLECIILDGQLEGTKTFITRVSFTGRYRNEDQCTFTRTQFPLRVSLDFAEATEGGPHSASIPTGDGSHRIVPSQRKEQHSSAFKLPTMPASKMPKVPSPKQNAPLSDDCWADFLDSSTQIARDLALEYEMPTKQLPSPVPRLPSTQDFDSFFEDLQDFEQSTPRESNLSGTIDGQHTPKQQGDKMPSYAIRSTTADHSRDADPKPSGAHRQEATRLNDRNQPLRCAPGEVPAECAGVRMFKGRPTGRLNTAPPSRAQPSNTPVTTETFSKRPNEPQQQTHYAERPAKKRNVTKPPLTSSFSDFGLSTQEVASIFEDDDLVFSSPPIAAS